MVGLLTVGLVALALPPRAAAVPDASVVARPFTWERDSLWKALEAGLVAARAVGCGDSAAVRRELAALHPADTALEPLEQRFFALAPRVAACGALVAGYVGAFAEMRAAVKRQSIAWDPNALTTRDRLYRALYGGRAAIEEVLLQQGSGTEPLLRGTDEPSATPSVLTHGVTLHSGDMLVSRGGYPTSALIARGNDYPGNFSHVALVHIDSATRAVTVIEAHIEKGVALTTAEGYLADKKLRVMVMRPRADLPALQRDPMLPHKAATAMLERSRSEHIPYDFAMDYVDSAKLFCSEVASQAYRTQGLDLWMGRSTISRTGLRTWLASFGVTHFETQEPSDLEYDPQLTVVAEWHDVQDLFEDHVANAVTDAMLEGAERGDALGYSALQLPLARVLKGYSWVRERMGGIGPIPEGMAPSAALRNRAYGARHDAHAVEVLRLAEAWRTERGYRPPYWVLVELARTVVR